MATVIIPFPFRKHTENQREVMVAGSTLAEVMENLLTLHPGLCIINEQPGLLSIFINGRNVDQTMDGWHEVPAQHTDEINLIIPIAGG